MLQSFAIFFNNLTKKIEIMKRFVLIAIKLLLVVLFLQNIHFFSFISTIDDKPQAPQKADGGRGDLQYLNEKIERAQKLGINYGPEEYFSDLTDIRLKEKANGFDRMASIHVFYTTNTLMGMFNNSVIRHHHDDSPKNYQAFMEELSKAQKKHLSITDPEQETRAKALDEKMAQPGYWLGVLFGLLSWLTSFYLKNFPLGLTLLWIWWYQEKERLSINNPLSFIICLLLYPIVIIRVWKKSLEYGARMFALKVEFKSRQTDIFSMISENELADIKRFAKSDLRISDYRKYLENRGLTYRHALMPAITVTILFLAIPKSYGDNKISGPLNDVVKYQMPIKAPPNISSDYSFHGQVFTGTVPELPKIFFIPIIWRFILPPVPNNRQGFKTNPDPVPVFC